MIKRFKKNSVCPVFTHVHTKTPTCEEGSKQKVVTNPTGWKPLTLKFWSKFTSISSKSVLIFGKRTLMITLGHCVIKSPLKILVKKIISDKSHIRLSEAFRPHWGILCEN